MSTKKGSVLKKVLPNGLTVLCCPKKNASKVSMQLWYNVGSKHEGAGERGMAHFIEHMIFKGTKKLTESDINMLTSKLSGYCNAFTSYDYTAYLFDVPTVNWRKIFPVFADCMRNCVFDEEHLFSEVKAVIQELKMYRDRYDSALVEKLLGTIFEAHPYHHPIIGYKQDLWSLNKETLHRFYQKYYTPQNAALVVVGDVNPEEVFQEAADQFTMVVDQELPKETFFVNQDVGVKSVSLIRDVQQSTGALVFRVPDARKAKDFYLDVLQCILAGGKSSRLYKLLVDELALVTSVNAFYYDLYDQGLFFISYKPKQEQDLEKIKKIVFDELQDLVDNGIRKEELNRAISQTTVHAQGLLEDVQRQASDIGHSFFAVGDGQFAFDKYNVTPEQVKIEVEAIISECLTPTTYYYGSVLQANDQQKQKLRELQEESDKEDTAILEGKERKSAIAPGEYVHSVSVDKLKKLPCVKPEKRVLKNGMTLYLYQSDSVETVQLLCRLRAGYDYDIAGKEGIGSLVSKMLIEGTSSRPLGSFAEELESYGMLFFASPGSASMTMLGKDLKHGVELFVDAFKNASFDRAAFDRVLDRAKIQVKDFWDQPNQFVGQLAHNIAYKGHPRSKNSLGTKESLASISHADVIDFYKKYISPQDSVISIVGNFENVDLDEVVDIFESWTGEVVEKLSYPSLIPVKEHVVYHDINRDQVTLAFVGQSIDRMHPDYYKVVIFDQIFGGGSVMSMNSRLFQLREQSGLFYTIMSSLLSGADDQPGMVFIKTIVSKDRLEEAKTVILEQVDQAIDTITDQEIEEAREVIINKYSALFDKNITIASTILWLDRYNLRQDYLNDAVSILRSITKDEIKQAVKKILRRDRLVTIEIGRTKAAK